VVLPVGPDPVPTPTLAIVPTLQADATYTPCASEVTLDASTSYAVPLSGPKAFTTTGLTVRWSLTGVQASGSGVYDVGPLSAYLSNAVGLVSTQAPIRLPVALLPTEGSVNVTATFSTSGARSVNSTLTLTAVPQDMPRVTIDGPRTQVMRPTRGFAVSASVSLGCIPLSPQDLADAVPVTFVWTMARRGVDSYDPWSEPQGPPTDFGTTRQASIPVSLLVVGQRYDVTVTATWLHGQASLTFTDTILVEVHSWEEVCLGCSLSLTVAGGPSHAIGVQSPLVLSLLAVDVDGADLPLEFSWSCVEAAGGGNCTSVLTQAPLNLAAYTNGGNGSLTLPNGTLAIGRYTLVATAVKGLPWHIEPRHYRNTSVVVAVEVRPAPVTEVLVLRPITQPLTVSPGQGVVLEGAVSGSTLGAPAVNASWTLTADGQGPEPTGPLLYAASMTLAFARVSAVAVPGTRYVFTFAGAGPAPATPGAASVVLVVNGAPSGGIVSASVASATAMVTPITLLTYGWTDAAQVRG
jgi:hypothetical protein